MLISPGSRRPLKPVITVTKWILWWGSLARVPLIISRLDFTTWKFLLEAGLAIECIRYDHTGLQGREQLSVQWLKPVNDLFHIQPVWRPVA